ncbi:hypothetical protein B7P43_G12398 [Cryptotermes secundus]|uniref:Uncharacterized protein n=1 Tax=Cryptotermes secundus TaxID=105785 RepID=A0A2J7PRQ3_9NEOP|nr:hypothetical protein B7P43_G12398 [Cryptotermes secundus]
MPFFLGVSISKESPAWSAIQGHICAECIWGLVTQLTKTEKNAHRKKRGLFNFVGQISHSLFAILGSENEVYNSRINQLELWISLKRNSWIYIVPVPSQMTILCPAQQPTELEIKNSGILSFLLECTGYSDKVMIRSVTSHYVNHTRKDIFPALYLPLDCCENDKTKIHLGKLQLETPLKNGLTHNDKLRLVSHKVEDVEKLKEEQEWKLKHENSTRQLSLLSSVGAVALVLLIGILCCCCRCCRNCWPKFVKWAWDDSKCSTVIFKPKIINSVHTSNDSLHRRGAMLSLATHMDDNTPKEFTEMNPMNATIGVRVSRTSSRNQAVSKR